MKNRTELTRTERDEIAILNNKRYSQRAIARALERSPNTISYELTHNSTKGIYDPKKAHAKAMLADNADQLLTTVEVCTPEDNSGECWKLVGRASNRTARPPTQQRYECYYRTDTRTGLLTFLEE